MRRFRPGEPLVRREVMHGKVWFGSPVICVEDSDRVFATYTPTGAEFGYTESTLAPHPWQLAGHTAWSGHGMLALHWPGVDHAVFVFWEGPERRFASWYFNLQDAPRRTPIGFDTLDHELDLVWPAGAPTWHWKDEEQFVLTAPYRYPDRVDQIRSEADRVAKRLNAGERWWDEAWASFRPDPQWTVPKLPPGWDKVPTTTR